MRDLCNFSTFFELKKTGTRINGEFDREINWNSIEVHYKQRIKLNRIMNWIKKNLLEFEDYFEKQKRGEFFRKKLIKTVGMWKVKK